jgi:zinc/manganese transport system ATP-binding protein
MMVAHDVNPVLVHLDTVVYLVPGGSRIGPPRQVITGPALTQLFGTPIEVLTASDGRLVVISHPERREGHSHRHAGQQL